MAESHEDMNPASLCLTLRGVCTVRAEEAGWTLVWFDPIRSQHAESVQNHELSCLTPLTQPFISYLITFRRIVPPLANLPVSSM